MTREGSLATQEENFTEVKITEVKLRKSTKGGIVIPIFSSLVHPLRNSSPPMHSYCRDIESPIDPSIQSLTRASSQDIFESPTHHSLDVRFTRLHGYKKVRKENSRDSSTPIKMDLIKTDGE